MDMRLIAALVISLLGGVAMASVNYVITNAVMKKKPNMLSITAVIRQVINVAYLAAVYFVSSAVLSSVVYPLVGAVVGLTVPMFIFTFKLVKKYDSAEK